MMLPKVDNLGGRLVPRSMRSSALNSVNHSLEESFCIHRTLEPERRIGDVEHSVSVFEATWLSAGQCSSRLSTRHTLTPRSPTIRQPPIGKNDGIKCNLINGLTENTPTFFDERLVVRPSFSAPPAPKSARSRTPSTTGRALSPTALE